MNIHSICFHGEIRKHLPAEVDLGRCLLHITYGPFLYSHDLPD